MYLNAFPPPSLTPSSRDSPWRRLWEIVGLWGKIKLIFLLGGNHSWWVFIVVECNLKVGVGWGLLWQEAAGTIILWSEVRCRRLKRINKASRWIMHRCNVRLQSVPSRPSVSVCCHQGKALPPPPPFHMGNKKSILSSCPPSSFSLLLDNKGLAGKSQNGSSTMDPFHPCRLEARQNPSCFISQCQILCSDRPLNPPSEEEEEEENLNVHSDAYLVGGGTSARWAHPPTSQVALFNKPGKSPGKAHSLHVSGVSDSFVYPTSPLHMNTEQQTNVLDRAFQFMLKQTNQTKFQEQAQNAGASWKSPRVHLA